MNLWLQVYNLQADEKIQKTFCQYRVRDYKRCQQSSRCCIPSESTDTMGNIGDQITLEKSLALTAFQPGIYRLTVKVDDNVSKQQIAPSVRFAVE